MPKSLFRPALACCLAAGLATGPPASGPVRAEAARNLSLTIENGGSTPVAVQSAAIAGGSWLGGFAPVQGSRIEAGAKLALTASAQDPSATLAGEISLIRGNGARYLLRWVWAPAGSAWVQVRANGPSAGVTTRSAGTAGANPSWQVILR